MSLEEFPATEASLQRMRARGLLEPPPPPPPPSGMAGSGDRLARLEGAYDALKVVRPMTLTVIAVVATVFGVAIAFIANQTVRLETRIDRLETSIKSDMQQLRSDLAAEMRATRAELSGVATAIAASITAARTPAPQIEPPKQP